MEKRNTHHGNLFWNETVFYSISWFLSIENQTRLGNLSEKIIVQPHSTTYENLNKRKITL